VQEGDVLVKLDPGDLPIKRDQDKDTLDDVKKRLAGKLANESLLEKLKKDHDSNKESFDKGFYAPALYHDEELSIEAQQITADTERSSLETQQKTLTGSIQMDDYLLKQYEIDAPYNGTITTVSAHAGDQLAKGASIAGLISRDLRIEAQVDQDDIAAVQENEQADVHFFAYPDKVFRTRVKNVLPSSDQSTQRFTVLLELVDPVMNLRDGLTGEVSFHADKHDNVLWVPRQSLYGTSVFVVTNGRVEIRQVKPGFKTLTQAEILPNADPHATVSEGDIVLTENLDLFRDGDRVRVTLPPAKAGTQ